MFEQEHHFHIFCYIVTSRLLLKALHTYVEHSRLLYTRIDRLKILKVENSSESLFEFSSQNKKSRRSFERSCQVPCWPYAIVYQQRSFLSIRFQEEIILEFDSLRAFQIFRFSLPFTICLILVVKEWSS